MRLVLLVAVILFSGFAMAATAPPSFDPGSVPERLQALEGRIAYIKVPSQEEAPLDAAEGAVLKGSVPAEVVTPENAASIPIELAQREMQFDRFVQGYISEADMVAFMHKQAASFVMLKDGTAVRIIAPQVDDGFATQVLPLTGDISKAELGGEMHLWVNSCFLRFARAANQRLFHQGKTCR